MVPIAFASVPLELCFLPFVAGALVNAVTIKTPPLVPRAQTTLPPDLIGYTSKSGKFETWSCRSNSAFQTIGSYGQCCSTARPDCFMATTCISGSIMANADFSSTCTGSAAQTSCVTGTIYHSIGDQIPIMNYQCWPQWNSGNWEATIITTQPSPTSISTSLVKTTLPGDTGSLASLPTPTSMPTSTATEPNEKSKAWIAGPVIGSVLGAIFFTHFGVWLYRRHLQRQQASSGFNEMSSSGGGSEGKTLYMHEVKIVGGAGNGADIPAELSDHACHEMDGNGPKTMMVEADGATAGTRSVEAPRWRVERDISR